MAEPVDVDAIALLPRNEPYAARFVAGLLAFERDAVELGGADEAPEPLASLALACAMRGWDWSMGIQGEAYSFVLDLRRARGGALALISQSAKYATHYVVEPTAPCRVWQVWDDDDGAHDMGDLERFCRALLETWFSMLDPDVDADELAQLPLLGNPERDTLLRYLRIVTDRRRSLATELAAQVATLEAQIADAAPDTPQTDELLAKWLELGDLLAIAGSAPPWPTYALSLDDEGRAQ